MRDGRMARVSNLRLVHSEGSVVDGESSRQHDPADAIEVELFEATLKIGSRTQRCGPANEVVAVEVRAAGTVSYVLRRAWSEPGDEGWTIAVFRTVEELCDATLPRAGEFSISSMEFDICSMLEDWSMRNPDVVTPCVLVVNDQFVGLLRLGDTMRWVPGGLVANVGLGNFCAWSSREMATVEWEVSFWWETGAMTSFSHDEALLRFEDLYFLQKRHNDCTDMHFIGQFDSRSEARLAAARISEAPFYREVVAHFGDEAGEGWSGDDQFLDGQPIVIDLFGDDD